MTNARNDFSLDSELDQTVGWDEDETHETLETDQPDATADVEDVGLRVRRRGPRAHHR